MDLITPLATAGAREASPGALSPFTFSCQYRYENATGAGQTTCGLVPDPTDPYAGYMFVGARFGTPPGGGTPGIQVLLGNQVVLSTLGTAWAGFTLHKYYTVSVTYDGGPYVVVTIGGNGTAAPQPPYFATVPVDFASLPIGMPQAIFARLAQICVTSNEVHNTLVGVAFQTGEARSPSLDVRHVAQTVACPVIMGDASGVLYLPRTYTAKSALDVVIVGHPKYLAAYPAFATLIGSWLFAGMAVATITGDISGNPDSPTANDWGRPQGLAFRRELIEYVKFTCPNLRHVFWADAGPGVLSGLAFHRLYPSVLRALLGYGPIIDLSLAYAMTNTTVDLTSQVSYQDQIQRALGGASYADVQGQDPMNHAAAYLDLPMALLGDAATGYTTYASHAAAFLSAVNAAKTATDQRSGTTVTAGSSSSGTTGGFGWTLYTPAQTSMLPDRPTVTQEARSTGDTSFLGAATFGGNGTPFDFANFI